MEVGADIAGVLYPLNAALIGVYGFVGVVSQTFFHEELASPPAEIIGIKEPTKLVAAHG